MHHVFGTAFWHVAIRAAGRLRVSARGHCLRKLRAMTLPACSVVMPYRTLAARNFMRIVATGAFEQTFALLEASRLANPIHCIHDLELVLPSHARRMIEKHPV